MGCMLFGVFFCFSRSFAQDFAVDFDFHVEGLVVVRSFAAAQLDRKSTRLNSSH